MLTFLGVGGTTSMNLLTNRDDGGCLRLGEGNFIKLPFYEIKRVRRWMMAAQHYECIWYHGNVHTSRWNRWRCWWGKKLQWLLWRAHPSVQLRPLTHLHHDPPSTQVTCLRKKCTSVHFFNKYLSLSHIPQTVSRAMSTAESMAGKVPNFVNCIFQRRRLANKQTAWQTTLQFWV